MSARAKIALTVGICSLPLLGFWLYGLFDLDEGFYAAVVAEMNRRGEWITPFYGGSPWFEKPILMYWLAKPAVLAFGQAVGPRLPSALSTVALLAVCGSYLRKQISTQAGQWAVFVLGTSILVFGLGRFMSPDAVLDLLICGAFLSFFHSLTADRKWRLLSAALLGLTVLCKGPMALPLFAALAIWTYVSEPDLRPAFKGYWFLGTLILLATVSLWYAPAYFENGKLFIDKFLVEQNLQRFGGGDKAHAVPIALWVIYYPAVLLVGMLPWSIPLVKVWSVAFRSNDVLSRYLARWSLVILVFFTLSGTKLPHYILPAVPPLAMLLGGALAARKFSWGVASAASAAACVSANACFLVAYRSSGMSELDTDARLINQKVNNGSGELVAYRLSESSQLGPFGMRPTSDPSLRFYVDSRHTAILEVNDLATLTRVLQTNEQRFVLTRPGNLKSSDFFALRQQGIPIQAVESLPPEKYALYEVANEKK